MQYAYLHCLLFGFVCVTVLNELTSTVDKKSSDVHSFQLTSHADDRIHKADYFSIAFRSCFVQEL
jgi:hypothetical protein